MLVDLFRVSLRLLVILGLGVLSSCVAARNDTDLRLLITQPSLAISYEDIAPGQVVSGYEVLSKTNDLAVLSRGSRFLTVGKTEEDASDSVFLLISLRNSTAQAIREGGRINVDAHEYIVKEISATGVLLKGSQSRRTIRVPLITAQEKDALSQPLH